MVSRHYLEDVGRQFRKLKGLADRCLLRLSDDELFSSLEGTNSVAIVVKHMAGNMRSRWTDFLTTDGDKPDRRRDREFVIEDGDSRSRLLERWEAGWRQLFDALEALGGDDLLRTVFIRGEPHTVLEAIQRQLSHYAYHVGQIVLLARHFKGDRWQSLSIPPGKSEEFEVSKEGALYGLDGSQE